MLKKHNAPRTPSARVRLLAAADALFYSEGINTVGIDRIIERAGVAKASLYGTFGSKEELIRAYLAARHEVRKYRIMDGWNRCTTPREKLLSIFVHLDGVVNAPGFRGCAFIKATSETQEGSRVRNVCDESRQWMLMSLTELATEMGAVDPDLIARQLLMLHDGALVAAQSDHQMQSARQALKIAEILLESAAVKPPRKRRKH